MRFMKRSVEFKGLAGQICAPPSKSAAQRALAIALIKKQQTELFNVAGSEDILNSVEVIRNLGADVEFNDKSCIVKGGLNPLSRSVNFGEAGLAVRMFSPVISLLDFEMELNGRGSLLNRPVSMIEEPLRQLGVDIVSNNGYLPVKIKGPIKNNRVTIDGSISSQFLTGMLIAKGETENIFTINTSDLKSRPYIDLTISMMKYFGVEVINRDYNEFIIHPGQKYNCPEYTVEGDWSGASFFIAAAAVSGEIEILNLDEKSAQADIAMVNAARLAGADINFINGNLVIRNSRLKPFEFDASECPDLFPPLVSLAVNIQGKSVIKGVHRLKHKESDRGIVLKKEFAKLGIDIIIENDSMIVEGGSLKSGCINSNNDHRIAMAGAAAACGGITVEIEDSEAVNKSYSSFYNDVIKVGGIVEQLR